MCLLLVAIAVWGLVCRWCGVIRRTLATLSGVYPSVHVEASSSASRSTPCGMPDIPGLVLGIQVAPTGALNHHPTTDFLVQVIVRHQPAGGLSDRTRQRRVNGQRLR
jgi:hypothetical protein